MGLLLSAPAWLHVGHLFDMLITFQINRKARLGLTHQRAQRNAKQGRNFRSIMIADRGLRRIFFYLRSSIFDQRLLYHKRGAAVAHRRPPWGFRRKTINSGKGLECGYWLLVKCPPLSREGLMPVFGYHVRSTATQQALQSQANHGRACQ